MDAISRELSTCIYHGFECINDTCATVQMTRRATANIANQFFNMANSYNKQCFIGAGSVSDGTALLVFTNPADCDRRSDIDQMRVDKQFQVYPIGYKGDNDCTKYCLQLKRSEHTRPGYCLVEVVGEMYINLDFYIKYQQHQLHEYFLRQFKSDVTSSNICVSRISTGPAVTYVNTRVANPLTGDAVTCFASNHWSGDCRNWSDLFKWPSVTLQEAIKKEGFHIVNVGHPLSPERDKEWRMSFSVAEKMLIHDFNPTQLTCAVVMRWLMNHYIKPVVPDSINSYHIKTLMLWSVEQDSDQIWEPEYFIHCLEYLLTNLMECILICRLQHYFIPENNLFKCKVTTEKKEILFQEVGALRSLVFEKCISLLRVTMVTGISIFPSVPQTIFFQAFCVNKVAFKTFCFEKTRLRNTFILLICDSMKLLIDWRRDTYISQNQLYTSLVDRITSVLSSNHPNSNKEILARVSDKWFSFFKTWCGIILIALYKSKVRIISMEGNNTNNLDSGDILRYIYIFGQSLLTESYEDASTTGCIKMSLFYICKGNHYHAIPLLNRSLNIIDQFENYSLFKEIEEIPIEYNFTEYMHLYNDQQAIECALVSELLNDKVLNETPFLWLEMNLLPHLLQLELTQTFYNIDIFKLLPNQYRKIKPYLLWNPIPLTHFLLFISHYELLKSVTFLDRNCLQDDINNLQSLIPDRKRLREDEVRSVLNLLTWCYLQIGEKNVMVKHAVKTVQQSTGCDKTLFSHLFIQHVIDTVITQDVGSNVSDRKVLVYHRIC